MKQIIIHIMEHDDYVFTAKANNVPDWSRGFAVGDAVFVCKEHLDLELIGHEVGHCLGRRHSWFPAIMHPYGWLRWFTNPIGAAIKGIKHWRK